MPDFPLYTLHSAPENSKQALQTVHETFGFVPNIAAAMAGSAVLIQGFLGVFQTVHSGTFTEPQIQTLLLTNAVTNACPWAVAFHSMLALREGLLPADVLAMREGRPPKDPTLAALSAVARNLIEMRGNIDPQVLSGFMSAGFTQDQVLEVILVVAASTITNYTGNVTNPPLDEGLDAHAWVHTA